MMHSPTLLVASNADENLSAPSVTARRLSCAAGVKPSALTIDVKVLSRKDAIENNFHVSNVVVSQSQSDTDEVDSQDSACKAPLQSNLLDTPSNRKGTGLTLSAFWRPENVVNLTKSDFSRRLELEYDLHSSHCGVLGHGAFSTVRLAVRRHDGMQVAIKSIAKHEALRARRLRVGGPNHMEEWDILRRMNGHPFIISILDVYETEEEVQLVMEYCRGGELFDAIKKKKNRSHGMRRGQYTENQASCITGQILRALADLHRLGIAHRDVKPENILLTSADASELHVKLCDFGVARSLPIMSFQGGDSSPLTPGRVVLCHSFRSDYYVAPEVYYGGDYDTAVDMYSLGVTLYILLCGFPPVFSGVHVDEVVFPDTYWKDISDGAKAIVRKMLSPDPTIRITAREALDDPWIVESIAVVPQSSSSDDFRGPFGSAIDLDLVRSRLYLAFGCSNLEVHGPKRPASASSSGVKRQRVERRASATFLALADLYRGVASSPSVAAIAVGNNSPRRKERASSLLGSPSKVLRVEL